MDANAMLCDENDGNEWIIMQKNPIKSEQEYREAQIYSITEQIVSDIVCDLVWYILLFQLTAKV